jgi:hypothetical protein
MFLLIHQGFVNIVRAGFKSDGLPDGLAHYSTSYLHSECLFYQQIPL